MTHLGLIFWGVLSVVNLLAVSVMAWDKWSARQSRRRVPEKTLWTLALFGGAWGIWGGMFLFRHKTQHQQFVWGIPILVALETWALLLFARLAV